MQQISLKSLFKLYIFQNPCSIVTNVQVEQYNSHMDKLSPPQQYTALQSAIAHRIKPE